MQPELYDTYIILHLLMREKSVLYLHIRLHGDLITTCCVDYRCDSIAGMSVEREERKLRKTIGTQGLARMPVVQAGLDCCFKIEQYHHL